MRDGDGSNSNTVLPCWWVHQVINDIMLSSTFSVTSHNIYCTGCMRVHGVHTCSYVLNKCSKLQGKSGMMEFVIHLVFMQLRSVNLTYFGQVTEQEVWRIRANLEPKLIAAIVTWLHCLLCGNGWVNIFLWQWIHTQQWKNCWEWCFLCSLSRGYIASMNKIS